MMKKILLAAATSLVFAGAAGAATQGQLSSTSSVGTIPVSATIPALVQISGLTDQSITFTAAQVAAAASTNSSVAQLAESFCVYSNTTAAGNYGITISDAIVPAKGGPSNPGNETFGLTGAGGTIPMRVSYWDNVNNQFALGIPVNGTKISGLTTNAAGGPRPNSLTCADVGGSDAGINISFPAAGVLAAVEGTYTGTVTLTVTPT